MGYLDDNGLLYLWSKIKTLLANKVDKVSGKQLSTNDYTTAEKTKLSGIAEGANKTIVDSAWSTTSLNPVQNKLITARLDNLDEGVLGMVNSKVDKEDGKQLSTNDYTAAEKNKLASLNNYTHPTTDGNKHVPATGTANNGKALIAGSTAGTFSWQALTKSMVGLGSVDNTSDLNKPISTAVKNALTGKLTCSIEPINSEALNTGITMSNVSTPHNEDMLAIHDSCYDLVFNVDGSYKTRYYANGPMSEWKKSNVFTDTLLTKLNGISAGANNYVHPSTHPATMITPDATHGFVTDEEKKGWNNHTASKGNPHSVTKAQVGLGNADNTSDINKPISSAMQIALDNKAGTGTVTTSRPGLMSVSDKVKLDAFGAASTYALKSDIVGMYKYKGSIADASKLPTTGQTTGDVYNIVAPSIYGAAGANVAWDGSKWDSLGEIFTITSITNAQIDTICA